jgi:hypothetical protein
MSSNLSSKLRAAGWTIHESPKGARRKSELQRSLLAVVSSFVAGKKCRFSIVVVTCVARRRGAALSLVPVIWLIPPDTPTPSTIGALSLEAEGGARPVGRLLFKSSRASATGHREGPGPCGNAA